MPAVATDDKLGAEATDDIVRAGTTAGDDVEEDSMSDGEVLMEAPEDKFGLEVTV